jgi:xylulokinase
MGLDTGRIRLCGGGAKSRVWAHIRADLCQRPIEIAKVTDASPLGAALLASVAAGLSKSVDEAVSQMSIKVTAIDPNPARVAAYNAAYQRYRTLFEALRPLYAD